MNASNTFVVQPTRKRLAREINTSLDTTGIGEKVVKVLKTYPNPFQIWVELRTDGESGVVTRDERVRESLRELLSKQQAATVEGLLMKYHELWSPKTGRAIAMRQLRIQTEQTD